MPKKGENLFYLNYLVLVQSMLEKNGFRRWNAHVKKYFSKPVGGTRIIRLNCQNFDHFDLRGANLAFADFSGSRLTDCKLNGTDSNLNDLRGAIFDSCDLRGADLSYALLSSSSFTNSTLIDKGDSRQASLRNSVLEGSMWHQSRVSAHQLSKAHIHGALNIDSQVAKKISELLYQSLINDGNPNTQTSGIINDDDHTPLPAPKGVF